MKKMESMKKQQGIRSACIRKATLFLFLMSIPLSVMAKEWKISLPEKQMTILAAFAEIEKQTDLTVAYNASKIDVNKSILVHVKNKSLPEAMTAILKGTDHSFKVEQKQIIVIAAKSTYGAVKKYKGIVLEGSGEPIIGATVSVKDKNIGTVTDIDGKFSIEAGNGSTISISYVGFTPKILQLGEESDLRIVIDANSQLLDEVVVVGYGTQKRVNLTGAVSTISAKDIGNRPVISAANALQGADPSVNLSFGTGSPESDYSIDIRGAVSLNSGAPLVLADGIEVSLRQINPNDIESVSVLKDASASAIYGAKASAGVILITTKSGGSESGKAKISYSGRIGWAQNTTSTDFITTGYDHVTLTNRFYNSYNGIDMFLYPEATGELQKLLDRRNDKTEQPGRPWVEVGPDGKYNYYANFDWFDYFYNRTRSQQEHNVSVTGGNNKFNYYVSARYLNQNGVFKIFGDNFENFSFRTKMSAKVTSWLRYSNNISLDKSEMKFPGRPEYEQTISSLQANISPAFMPLNPDGSIVQYTNQLYSGSPLGTGYAGSMTANNTRNSKSTRYIVINNQLDFDITKDLALTASYGYKMRDPINRYRNNTFEYSRSLNTFETFTSGAVQNAYTENRYSEAQSNIDIYGTYKHTWRRKHNFTAVAGGQFTDFRYQSMQGTQTDLSNDDLDSFAVGTGIITLQQKINTLRTLGFFARANYDYSGKYLFEVSGRADGSSRFKKSSRWGVFPSASVGWRVSEENFFEPMKYFWDNLKVRFSVGSLGNQQVSEYYTFIDQISINNKMDYTFDDKGLAYYASVTPPKSANLTWETVTSYNLGLDMTFFKNRLNVTTDLYIRDTKNMLRPSITLPDVYGATSPPENCADLRTKGYEIYIGWKDNFKLGGESFRYGISATLGDYLSKITKYRNPDKMLTDPYVGQTLGEIWGYHVTGLFKTDGEAAEYQARINDVAVNQRVYNSKGLNANYLRAGDVRFADLDGDNIISGGSGNANDPGDRRIIGNSLPRYSYSFRLDLSWNNFDISAFFQGVGKRNWYPASGQASYDFWGPYAFPSTSFIHQDFESNCWSEENPNAYFPRQRGYQAYGGGALGEVNDRYLQNIAYLRLKNVSVGYTFPIKKYIDQLRLSFTGENLWYWSPLKKYSKTIDPELASTQDTYNSNSGVGYFYSKIYSVNLNITF